MTPTAKRPSATACWLFMRAPWIARTAAANSGCVAFGGKYLKLRVIHEGVPKLINAVYARSTFLPQLPALDEVARISALETAVDVALGHSSISFDPSPNRCPGREQIDFLVAEGDLVVAHITRTAAIDASIQATSLRIHRLLDGQIAEIWDG